MSVLDEVLAKESSELLELVGISNLSASVDRDSKMLEEEAAEDRRKEEEERKLLEEASIQPCKWIVNPELTIKKAPDKARNWKSLVEAISPILQRVFPDGWEIKFELKDVVKYDESGDAFGITVVEAVVTVLFPEIFIQGAIKFKPHRIADLYVRFRISDDLKLTGQLTGTRGQLTIAEFRDSYAHSHLQSSAINHFSSFCQGSTTLVNISTELGYRGFFIDGKVDEESLLIFEAYLYQLHAFVSHQATNGTPFKRYERIGNGQNQRVDGNELYTSYSKFVRAYKDREIPVIFRNNMPCVNYCPELEEMLVKIAERTQFKASNGRMYSIIESNARQADSIDRNPSFLSFSFRGKKVTQEITYSEKPILEDKQIYCHEEIRNYIIERINSRIEDQYFDRAIREEYQRGHQTLVSGEKPWKTDSKVESFLKTLEPINANP